jgi:hypothetical protein
MNNTIRKGVYLGSDIIILIQKQKEYLILRQNGSTSWVDSGLVTIDSSKKSHTL